MQKNLKTRTKKQVDKPFFKQHTINSKGGSQETLVLILVTVPPAGY